MTWTILPVFIERRDFLAVKRVGDQAANAEAAISRISWVIAAWRALSYLEREFAEQFGGVVLGGLHCDHARAVLGGLGGEDQLVNVDG